MMIEAEKTQNISALRQKDEKRKQEALFEKKAAASCFLNKPTHPPNRLDFTGFCLVRWVKPVAVFDCRTTGGGKEC